VLVYISMRRDFGNLS